MPFTTGEAHHDPSATLREDPRGTARRNPGHKKPGISQTSDSSTSSVTAPVTKRVEAPKRHSGKPGPLSPRRTAELAGRSPGKGREGSEGSPSMGSSFSDLDGRSYLFGFCMRNANEKQMRLSPRVLWKKLLPVICKQEVAWLAG